ncbi:MAG: 3-phosphoserine/phosphohydroxythreonine transaminase [Lysobacteraceae bacterium]
MRAQSELLEWQGESASVMEISHRSKAFVALTEHIESDLRRLLQVPENYAVLFLQGGATQQFALIPQNFAAPDATADYLLTGHWGVKAQAEASPYVHAHVVATDEAGKFTTLPARSTWQLTPGAAYLHVTPNETIHGVEFDETALTDLDDVAVIGDVSSTMLSRPLDVSRYAMLYGGAQKNIGASGVTLLIIRSDLLARQPRPLAKILTYTAQAKEHSLLNTPNTFGWYLTGLVLQWIDGEGGLAALGARNQRKAAMLYAAIDGSGGFYSNPVDPRYRSWMNVPFVLHDAGLDAAFLSESSAAGLVSLKGHKAVGGMRASLYNAMPEAGVQALVEFMADFARRNG